MRSAEAGGNTDGARAPGLLSWPARTSDANAKYFLYKSQPMSSGYFLLRARVKRYVCPCPTHLESVPQCMA